MKLRFACWLIVGQMLAPLLSAMAASYLSPDAVTVTHDGRTLFVACATADKVLCVDAGSHKIIGSIKTPASPSGLVLSPDDTRLYLTCAAPESQVLVIDPARRKILTTIAAGHTAQSPVLSPDGKTLFVCNQFNDDVSVIDLAAKRETARIAVQREPVAADITRDGKYLLVANHLSVDRSDSPNVAAVVSVIDLAAGRTVKELSLPVGSEMLQDLQVSPDGKYAVVTHIFCNYDLPTRRVQLGLINGNALTIIGLANLEPLYTFLLDEPESGAGNPWGIAWSTDSSKLVIAHAGTHEISVIDFPALLAGLPAEDAKFKIPGSVSTPVLKFVPHYEDEELNDGLPFLVGARKRIHLPAGDFGPRALAVSGPVIYTANYFSDNLCAINLATAEKPPATIPLGSTWKMNTIRKGEFYFHDASLCFQGWQSCSSCHPGDGRVDALNWTLDSEDTGQPKNTRSLLLAYQSAPPDGFKKGITAMGDNPASATRTAIRTLLFTNQPEEVATDLDAYLKSLTPVASPYLVHGRLSPAAKHGAALFSSAGCARCHTPGLYTDRHWHNIGTRTRYDPVPDFRTPSLREVWRTAPYLHDGSAATIRDVLTTCNPGNDRHGDVAGLSDRDLDDLCAFVLSL